MHTPICVCLPCRIERNGLVSELRSEAESQEKDWVGTNYEPELLVAAANRIEELEAMVIHANR